MLSTQVYLDSISRTNEYKNIVTINMFPVGPLGHFVKRIQNPKLSEFKAFNETKKCVLSLVDEHGCLMNETEIPNLFSYLLSNGYTIDTSLTKMMNTSDVKFTDNKIICFITYNE